MVARCQLLHLARDGVDLCSRAVKGAPSHDIGPVTAFTADPAPAELLKEAELVGAFGLRVYRSRIRGVVAGSRETGIPVKVSSNAVVICH